MPDPSDPLSEASKATTQIAETTGKAIDAAREAGGFISKFVAGPLEQGMGIFEDRLRYMRWERQLRLMRRSEEVLRELGLPAPTRAVPLKIAIPLLQSASMEDEDELQDRWVNLLVNAANAESGIDIQRSYIEILSQISSLEARILDAVYSLPFESTLHNGVATANLPQYASVAPEDLRNEPEPSALVQLAIANLARLGCLKPGLTMGGGEYFSKVNPTYLGRSFVRACRIRKSSSSE